MRRKLNVTFTIEAEHLDRLDKTAERLRLNRSHIVREALDRELARLDSVPDAPSLERTPEQGSAVAPPTAATRR